MKNEQAIKSVLLVHNSYQLLGGEDQVFEAEKNLLTSRGINVTVYKVNNDALHSLSNKIKAFLTVSYSVRQRNIVSRLIKESNIDLVHVHNFFPLITPSIYDACLDNKVPVVQTLHNYRTICPGALLMRSGHICEECISGSPYKAIKYRCYKNSYIGSFSVAHMVSFHRMKATWTKKVNRFIALTCFAKQKFVDAGFPSDKILTKPNFFNDNNSPVNNKKRDRSGGLFVGRISSEKGVSLLIDAWKKIKLPLRLAGDGPLLNELNSNTLSSNVTFLGSISQESVREEMKKASFLVVPSLWYEGFPMVIVESFAHGLPVLCSNIGSMAEIVEDGETGLHFKKGDTDDLVKKIMWMNNHKDQVRQMGRRALSKYEKYYTPDKNYLILMEIYQQALDDAHTNH